MSSHTCKLIQLTQDCYPAEGAETALLRQTIWNCVKSDINNFINSEGHLNRRNLLIKHLNHYLRVFDNFNNIDECEFMTMEMNDRRNDYINWVALCILASLTSTQETYNNIVMLREHY